MQIILGIRVADKYRIQERHIVDRILRYGMITDMDRNSVAPALGRIVSGIYIATGYHEGEPTGMLCSFVEQAGFEPPMITIAVSAGRRLGDAIEESGKVGLNVLSIANTDLMKAFSNRSESPFDSLALTENQYELPQLSTALAFLACEIRNSMESGDHRVYLAEVIDGELMDDDGEPMVRIRRDGFRY